jgi:hypothetical protein
MSAYCVAADLYSHGLPPGVLPNPGRLLGAVDTGTEILTLDGHGFRADQVVLFRAEAGGSLPSPLVAGTSYYAIPLTDATFSVAASAGGSAINLTSTGSNVVVVSPLPVDEWIAWASAMVDSFIPAHVVPLSAPFPALVVSITAELAAARGLAYTGGQSQTSIQDRIIAAQRLLDRWGRGVPIRGSAAPASSNLAAVATASDLDPRGWVPSGGGI